MARKKKEEDIEVEIPEVEFSSGKANRFYDRIRNQIRETVENRGATGKTAEFLLLAPDLFILLFRLFNDPRVSAKNKAFLGSGIAYFFLPLDFLPEAVLGPVGLIDDVILAVYILNRMLIDTDEEILAEHWSGDGNILTVIRRVLASAEKLVSKKIIDRFKGMVDF